MSDMDVSLILLKQLLVDNVWREQSTNHVLQTLCTSHIQHQCYRVTPVCLKKRNTKDNKRVRTLLKDEDLMNFEPKTSTKVVKPIVEVWNDMTVKDLAASAQRDIDDVLDVLYIVDKGAMYEQNNVLQDFTVINETVKKLGAKVKTVARSGVKDFKIAKYSDIVRSPPDPSKLVKRHPVVTIMGHVDHGKTTLLDALRNTSVVETEFGGITQHIGAFNVTLNSEDRVTFLDTPGHAAFTSMRYRGAHMTDIVVLVVAADDGVKEQTLQSIEMAKSAKVPIIVAINKIDKPDADINRTQNMLAENGIVVEALGGDVQCVNISALKGTNLQELIEAVVVQAELMNLRGDPKGLVEGVAIECANHLGRGKLVTALIRRGTLRKGNVLVAGLAWGKVRAMFNDSGCPVVEAKPSEAVQIIGWKDLPSVGSEIFQVENDRELQTVLKFRESQRSDALAKEHGEAAEKRLAEHLTEYKKILAIKREVGMFHPVMKVLYKKKKTRVIEEEEELPEVNVIIKGDVAGSIEAILDIFDTYAQDEMCRLNVVHYGVGAVTETDLELARTFNAIIYRFNVNINHKLEEEANKDGLIIRNYKVIYKLIDDIKEEINSKLPEIDAEEVLGEASIQQEFKIMEGKKKVNVAGCRCTKGVLKKSAMFHLVRGSDTVYTGKLASMRHLKDEVSSVKVNIECGLRLDDPTVSFQPGDVLVCFQPYKTHQKVDWDPGF
ncbi:mitochondrial translation initiation factor 2 isoform X2 [Andrena cerasifolii]|uniref:mitochondrial translation initiation factor 2 isoform X2 n=1 Tax=Andrena cerasifolii TaxID=2819439 RepID=UPI0040376BEC